MSFPHPRSCYHCHLYWWHEPIYEEGGKSGPACDGPRGMMLQNLKSFPFKTEQKCFKEKYESPYKYSGKHKSEKPGWMPE